MIELINREDHQKLYLQLYEIIKRKIESGEWTVGSQIPTEEQLCKMFNISRATVRTAIIELVRQGYLKRQPGKGTFISKKVISEGLLMLTNLRELMFEDDSVFKQKILVRTVMMPIDGLHKELNIAEDKHIIFIKKLWFVEGEPSFLLESYIPYQICPLLLEEDLEKESLYDIFERRFGIKITKVLNLFYIENLKLDQSITLSLEENREVIVITQKCFSGDTIVLLNRFYKKKDKYSLFLEYERKAF